MGWKEAQERYHQGRTLTDQSVEDLVARRVLRGLGLTDKGLPRVERAIFGNVDYDEALWPRTLKMLKYALQTEHWGWYAASREFECYEAKGGDHKDILERLADLPAGEVIRPVFMTRLKGTTTSMTYSVWCKDSLHVLATPFSAISEMQVPEDTQTGVSKLRRVVVVVQETAHFVKQFLEESLFTDEAHKAMENANG